MIPPLHKYTRSICIRFFVFFFNFRKFDGEETMDSHQTMRTAEAGSWSDFNKPRPITRERSPDTDVRTTCTTNKNIHVNTYKKPINRPIHTMQNWFLLRVSVCILSLFASNSCKIGSFVYGIKHKQNKGNAILSSPEIESVLAHTFDRAVERKMNSKSNTLRSCFIYFALLVSSRCKHACCNGH